MEITASGSLLVFEQGDKMDAYQKKRLSIKLANGAIVIRYRNKDLYYIIDNDDVTVPSSSSMADLYSKLLALKA